MIIQSNGINAYSTTDQISQPPVEKQPAPPAEQKDTQANGFVTDRTDLSAKALALSRSVQSAGSTSETGEAKASEKGETKEEPAPSPPPRPQSNQQSPPAINIRV
jgi:hypothetical protein